MEKGASAAIPMAILGGSALIALGAYLGLRSREVGAPPPPDPPSVAAIALPSPAAPPSGVLPGPVPAAALALQGAPKPRLAEPASDVQAALERERPTFVERCWKPAVAKRATPAQSTYEFDLAFDEAGHATGVGISEIDATSRADVAQCLRLLGTPLHIPPPGERTHARVRFTLP
jgi:hypothetical protein